MRARFLALIATVALAGGGLGSYLAVRTHPHPPSPAPAALTHDQLCADYAALAQSPKLAQTNPAAMVTAEYLFHKAGCSTPTEPPQPQAVAVDGGSVTPAVSQPLPPSVWKHTASPPVKIPSLWKR